MKYCSKCGKEIMDEAVICPGCGCAVKSETEQNEISYDDCVNSASTTNIIAAIVLAVGVLCALFINVWVGAVLCLVSEIVALIPNSKMQKAFKSNNYGLDKKELKDKVRQYQCELKAKCSAFKFSFVLAYIALTCLIVFVLLGNALGL